MTWPPRYTIRRSTRAKNVSLRLYPGHGLEVVLPSTRRHFDTLAFLNKHREWVLKHAQKLKMVLDLQNSALIFPDRIELSSVNETIDIIYRRIEATNNISLHAQKNTVIFYGAIDSLSRCVPLIMQHLKKLAHHYFSRWLAELCEECKLSFEKLSIRSQRTVWGSCTECRHIQLNYKILFLPRELARYVLIHELCHTIHLDHSAAFWNMVECFAPDYKHHVKALHEADQYIPKWINS